MPDALPTIIADLYIYFLQICELVYTGDTTFPCLLAPDLDFVRTAQVSDFNQILKTKSAFSNVQSILYIFKIAYICYFWILLDTA